MRFQGTTDPRWPEDDDQLTQLRARHPRHVIWRGCNARRRATTWHAMPKRSAAARAQILDAETPDDLETQLSRQGESESAA